MVTVVSFNKRLPPAAAKTGRGTLAELMAKEKSFAEARGSAGQIETPTIMQGFGKLGQIAVNSMLENRAANDLREQQDRQRELMGQIDPLAGPTSEQIAAMGEFDIERMNDLWSARGDRLREAEAEAKRLAERGEERGWSVEDREDAQAAEAEAARIKAGLEGGAKLTDIASIRGDFNQDLSVKNIKNAQPIWSSVQDAETRDTPQADLNIIIGMAKLFDPTSVVRTEEGEAVRMTGDLPTEIFSQYKFLTGSPGARLSPEIRAGLLAEGQSRMEGYYDAYKKTSDYYTEIAKRHGVEPSDIVQPFDAPVRKEVVKQPPMGDDGKLDFKDFTPEEIKAWIADQKRKHPQGGTP